MPAWRDHTMDESESLSSLIGDIYDAALQSADWPQVLGTICSYVGGVASMIFWQDSALQTGNRYYSWGDDPHFTRLYFQKYIRLSPVIGIQHLVPIAEAVAVSNLVPQDEMLKSRFYREWMQPQGYFDNVFSLLDRSATSYATFAVARSESEGLVDRATLRRMALLVPHVRRAVLIGKVIDLHQLESARFDSVLDSLPASVFLVDERGAIKHANRQGAAMIAEGCVLSVRHGRLHAVDEGAQRTLQQLCTATALGDVAAGGQSARLIGQDGEVHVVQLLPLTSGVRREAGHKHSAEVAVFVTRAAIDATSTLEAVAQRYALTPREVQVLHGIVDVGGVPKVAAMLGISDRTVKAHLHAIFDKTGVRRQADLVKLVSTFAGPLRT